MEWNLKEIFKSRAEVFASIVEVRNEANIFSQLTNDTIDKNNLYDLLQMRFKIKERSDKALLYGSLVYYKNVFDDETAKLKETVEKFSVEVESVLDVLDDKILELGEEKIYSLMQEDSRLIIYKHFIEELVRKHSHICKDLALKTKLTNEISDQINLYNSILKEMEFASVVVDGKEQEINASNYITFITSQNRDVRRCTFLNVSDAFIKSKDRYASILDKLFGLRIRSAINEQYGSVLSSVLVKDNVEESIVFSLIDSVNCNIFLLQKYLAVKAQNLNIKDPHLYDYGISFVKDLDIRYTLEEAITIIREALKPLGEKYLDTVELLLEGHIDTVMDPKKHSSITFSWNTYSFMNFRGNYVDIKNLVHELGHIVNYYLSHENVDYMYEDSTIFVGETASILNEILLNRYLYDHAKNDDERLFYLSKEIENYITSVFRQTLYTEFEMELYSEKNSRKLTADLITKKYEMILKKYYGSSAIYDEEVFSEWCRLGHIFRWSFYNYKYATGLLIAGAIVNSLFYDKTLSVSKYIEFLSLGSSKSPKDLFRILNINIDDSKVIDSGFKILEGDIRRLIEIITKKR